MFTAAGVSAVLESGDHLTRAEFHRRYEARPDLKKAELVEGVVYVPSPVRSRAHSRPHAHVMVWIGTYALAHPEIHVEDNATVLLDGENEVQPDACLWREEPNGPHYTDDDYIDGAPQLVVEVAASSASYDLHEKLRAYRRNGVQEYLVWRVLDAAFDWFRLREGVFTRVEPDARGILESEVFPGLRLDVARLLAGDIAGVVSELAAG
jgi:Uma2 family endonuclease